MTLNIATQQQARVHPTETEAIAEHVRDAHRACHAMHDVGFARFLFLCAAADRFFGAFGTSLGR